MQRHRLIYFPLLSLTLFGSSFFAPAPSRALSFVHRPSANPHLAQSKPAHAPARWRGLIGEYGPDDDILIILEKDGKLCALFKRTELEPLDEVSSNVFKFPVPGPHAQQQLIFSRYARGRAT